MSLDSNLQIGLGSQLALHCTAKPEQSLQVSQFSWEFNGETFETSTDPNSHISRMGNKETLTRFNVQFEHAGSYRCRAHYSNGTIEDSNERQVMVVSECCSPPTVHSHRPNIDNRRATHRTRLRRTHSFPFINVVQMFNLIMLRAKKEYYFHKYPFTLHKDRQTPCPLTAISHCFVSPPPRVLVGGCHSS